MNSQGEQEAVVLENQDAAGWAPVRTRPFAPWPVFSSEEMRAVEAVLRSGQVNYWTGEEGQLFEQEFAAAVGCTYGVALMNGTLALELALRALGIGPGDEVIVPARTFVATAGAVVLVGARPLFADVDPVSQTLTTETAQAVWTPKTKALIAVHLAGWPCEMEPLLAWTRAEGLKVIEDGAQAHGATYRGRPVGSFGDAAAFSFCQDKILSTGGEGGMFVTNDPGVWERAWAYKDHGKDYEAVCRSRTTPGYGWVHTSFGTNGRMTEMQAAIGRVILRKLPEWVAVRRHHAAYLSRRFAQIPALRVTPPPDHVEHAYYKYYTFVRPERLRPGWNRDRVMQAVRMEGIPCYSGSCSEVYLEQAFQQAGLAPRQRRAQARRLGETALMFQVHPTLSRADLEDTCTAVEKVMERASR